MIIGNFTYSSAQDTYAGELATLTLTACKGRVPAGRRRGRQGTQLPCRQSEQGRRCRSRRRMEEAQRGGRYYLSVKLDDPALAQPINYAMVESGDRANDFILVWSRDSRKAKAE